MGNIIGAIIVAAGAAAVQAIGFYFLTKNHLAHLQQSCDRIEAKVTVHGEKIAKIEGFLDV